MAINVLIPTALQQFAGNQETLSVDGKTVKEAMSSLVSKCPDLKKHLYNDKGELRSFVNIYLNDEDIRHQKNQDTQLKPGDTMTIVPSIAGGGSDEAPAGRESRAVPWLVQDRVTINRTKQRAGIISLMKQCLSPVCTSK